MISQGIYFIFISIRMTEFQIFYTRHSHYLLTSFSLYIVVTLPFSLQNINILNQILKSNFCCSNTGSRKRGNYLEISLIFIQQPQQWHLYSLIHHVYHYIQCSIKPLLSNNVTEITNNLTGVSVKGCQIYLQFLLVQNVWCVPNILGNIFDHELIVRFYKVVPKNISLVLQMVITTCWFHVE